MVSTSVTNPDQLVDRQGAFTRQVLSDKTTINFQYIYHVAFWLLENSTTLQVTNK